MAVKPRITPIFIGSLQSVNANLDADAPVLILVCEDGYKADAVISQLPESKAQRE